MDDAASAGGTSTDLSEGLAHYRGGDRCAAAASCARVVPEHPAYADARQLLGVLAFECGDLVGAEALIAAAIAVRPGNPDFHYNLGNVLAAAGRSADAAASYRQALRLRPQDAASWNNLGNTLLTLALPAEAEQALRQALKYDRHNVVVWCNLGNALHALERTQEAATAYRRVLQLRPDSIQAAVNLAALLLDGAAAEQDLQDLQQALQKALATQPRSSALLNSLAAVRRDLGLEAAAEPLLRQAVDLDPDFAEAWNNLGAVLTDLGRLDDAQICLLRALALRPDYGQAYCNLGNALLQRGCPAQAQQAYERAQRCLPGQATAQWNLGLARLIQGDLGEGFALFEWRLRLPQARRLYPDLGVPLWQGEDLAGQRLLLYAEQGLGDSLQFIRYAPLLAARGAEVLLQCPAALRRLLASVAGIVQVLEDAESPERIAYACPIMSLPQRFATTLASIPAAVPYVSVPARSRDAWRARLHARSEATGTAGQLRVGLVWAGDPRPNDKAAQRIDRRRSLPLQALEPILALPGIAFHSLQLGAAREQLAASPFAGRITDWSAELSDMAETGALIEQLDLLISVDTAVVHLAGALARPVWVLSRFDACWRWLHERQDSPWYPTLRLFRCASPLAWSGVLAQVRDALLALREAGRPDRGA